MEPSGYHMIDFGYDLMVIMWPTSESHFYLSFRFIEMNFFYCHSQVIFFRT